MLAVQMMATHEAALECFRRAALREQTFTGHELGLRSGDKLVRSDIGPKHVIRMGDLCHWHIVTAWCFKWRYDPSSPATSSPGSARRTGT